MISQRKKMVKKNCLHNKNTNHFSNSNDQNNVNRITVPMNIFIISIFILQVFSNDIPNGFYFNEKEGDWEPCRSGYYCVNGTMIECSDGYFSHAGVVSECKKCGCDNCFKADVRNETTGKKIIRAGSCPKEGSCYPGHGLHIYTQECRICGPGFYSKGGNNSCQLCPPGWIAPDYGMTECIECKDKPATSSSRECIDCWIGHYIDNRTKYCLSCPLDTYSDQMNSYECKPCGPDHHSEVGSVECLEGPRKRGSYRERLEEIIREMEEYEEELRREKQKQ